MTKALIIGGDGFIGSRLAQKLKMAGYSICATTRRKNKKNKYFDLIKKKPIPDLSNYKAVFICAGMTSYDKCEAQKTLSRKINIFGVKKIISRLKETKAFLVYFSSSCVYSGRKKYHHESDKVSPKSEYSRQKVIIEKYIKRNIKDYAIIRIGKVVNEALPILSKWHEQLYEKRPITAYSDFTLSPVLLDDLVHISHTIVRNKLIGTFNVSASSEISYHRLAKIFCKEMRLRSLKIPKLESTMDPALRNIAKRHSVLNTEKIKSSLKLNIKSAEKVCKIMCHLYRTKYNMNKGLPQ